MIMAGGKGERLHPLTRERSKPAVPFGGRHRIIDFVLSNFLNSELLSLYVLVQYKSQSMIEHLRQAWRAGGLVPDHFITVVPPQMRYGENWYRGTADAVLQNLNLIDDYHPDLVAIFGADHIYRMDINQMVAFHREIEADVTVAARPVPVAQASGFGILSVDRESRIVEFNEKPTSPKPMPDDPTRAYVSMGNYVFSRRVLVDALLADARRSTDHDFGKTIIPELFPGGRVFAYDFQTNEVPGVKPYEEPAYWRDVGTLEAYWQCHMDLLGEEPRFDLDNRHWPIRAGRHNGPPVRVVGGEIDNAQVAEGSLIKRATIRNSILGRNVWVNEGAMIEDSIIMDYTTIGKGARLRRAIVDRFNIVPADAEIGIDPTDDRRRFHVEPSGLVVMPRGGRREFFLSGLEEF
jgi:glucose-1-phosphate adenylyltransferase